MEEFLDKPQRSGQFLVMEHKKTIRHAPSRTDETKSEGGLFTRIAAKLTAHTIGNKLLGRPRLLLWRAWQFK